MFILLDGGDRDQTLARLGPFEQFPICVSRQQDQEKPT